MARLNINLSGIKPAEDFEAYPSGDYVLQIAKADATPTNDGSSQYLKMTCSIICGPGASTDLQGKTMFHNKPLSEKAAPFLKKLFNACGITEDMINANGGAPDTDWLINRQFVARVSQKDYNGKMVNNVDQEKPIEAWTHAAGNKAAPQPSMMTAVPAPIAPPMPAAAQAQQPVYQQPVVQQQPGFVPPPQTPFNPGNGQAVAQPVVQQPTMGFPAPPPPGGMVPGQS